MTSAGGSSSSACLGAGFDQMFRLGGIGDGSQLSFPLFAAESRGEPKNN